MARLNSFVSGLSNNAQRKAARASTKPQQGTGTSVNKQTRVEYTPNISIEKKTLGTIQDTLGHINNILGDFKVRLEQVASKTLPEMDFSETVTRLRAHIKTLDDAVNVAADIYNEDGFSGNQSRRFNDFSSLTGKTLDKIANIIGIQSLDDTIRMELTEEMKPQLQGIRNLLDLMAPTKERKPVANLKSQPFNSNNSVAVALAEPHSVDSFGDQLRKIGKRLKDVAESTITTREYNVADVNDKSIAAMKEPFKQAVLGLVLPLVPSNASSSLKHRISFIDLSGAQALLDSASKLLSTLTLDSNLKTTDIPTLNRLESFIKEAHTSIASITTLSQKTLLMPASQTIVAKPEKRIGLIYSNEGSVAMQFPATVINDSSFVDMFKQSPQELYRASQVVLQETTGKIEAQLTSALEQIVERRIVLEGRQQEKVESLAQEQSRSEAATRQMVEGKRFMQTLKKGSPEDLLRALKGRVASAKESSKPGVAEMIGDRLYQLRKDFHARFQSNPKATAEDASKLAMLTKACALIQEHLAQSVTYQRKDGGRASVDRAWLHKLSSAA